jgi:type II secretory pathway component PulF
VTVRLAELLRAGVPLVEAIRVLAPTAGAALRAVLIEAAGRLERGDDLAAAFSAPAWFDAEFVRLLEVSQRSGELAPMLLRVGRRYERQSRRLIDRLTRLLEPAVILALGVLVGTVVMAAVLPILRLQEILR